MGPARCMERSLPEDAPKARGGRTSKQGSGRAGDGRTGGRPSGAVRAGGKRAGQAPARWPSLDPFDASIAERLADQLRPPWAAPQTAPADGDPRHPATAVGGAARLDPTATLDEGPLPALRSIIVEDPTPPSRRDQGTGSSPAPLATAAVPGTRPSMDVAIVDVPDGDLPSVLIDGDVDGDTAVPEAPAGSVSTADALRFVTATPSTAQLPRRPWRDPESIRLPKRSLLPALLAALAVAGGLVALWGSTQIGGLLDTKPGATSSPIPQEVPAAAADSSSLPDALAPVGVDPEPGSPGSAEQDAAPTTEHEEANAPSETSPKRPVMPAQPPPSGSAPARMTPPWASASPRPAEPSAAGPSAGEPSAREPSAAGPERGTPTTDPPKAPGANLPGPWRSEGAPSQAPAPAPIAPLPDPAAPPAAAPRAPSSEPRERPSESRRPPSSPPQEASPPTEPAPTPPTKPAPRRSPSEPDIVREMPF